MKYLVLENEKLTLLVCFDVLEIVTLKSKCNKH